jgi:hypothetical protein
VLATVPGKYGDDEKRAMFTRWLQTRSDFETARTEWEKLATVKNDFKETLDCAIAVSGADGADDVPAVVARLQGMRRPGESLTEVTTRWCALARTLWSADDATRAMRFMREDLARRPWPFAGPTAADHFQDLLDTARSLDTATDYWKRLGGEEAGPPSDLPARFDAFAELCKAENGDAPGGMLDYETLRDTPDTRPIGDRVKEFGQLSAMVDEDRLELYKFVHGLDPSERAPFLRLQAATRKFYQASEEWGAARNLDDAGRGHDAPVPLTAAQLDERVGVLLPHVSDGYGAQVLAALLATRRPGESLTDAARIFASYVSSFPRDFVDQAIAAWPYGHGTLGAAEEPLYLRALTLTQSADDAQRLWEALGKTGTAASLGARLDALAARPDAFGDAVSKVEAVAVAMPSGVDVDRAALALLDAETAMEGGAQNAAGRLESMGGDRTAALEAAARVVAAGRDEETVDDAWQIVAEKNVPGTVTERAALVGTLLQGSLDGQASGDAYDADEARREAARSILGLVKGLDSLPADEYSAAAAQASALMSAMRGHAREAADGLGQLLRERQRFGSLRVDEIFERFATAYVTGATVDEAIRSVEQGTKPAGTIERQDDQVVIGGIPVPRREPGGY